MAKTTYVNLKLGQMRSKPPKSRKWTALSWMISFVLVLSVLSFLGNLSSASLYLLTDVFAKPRCTINPRVNLITNNNMVYHDGDLFLEDYKEMKNRFKIYIYPHEPDEPFANVLLPVEKAPEGNYASEHYFNMVLSKSGFVTDDPNAAHLFYLPFSIVGLRNDPRIGVRGIPDFVRDYMWNVSHEYPYWNRSGGTDHFYVACHSIGQSAMNKASQVKFNSIQLVCTSSYHIAGYISHKDAGMPQIWPRDEEDPPNLLSSKRTRLAFFAGAINCEARRELVKVWGNDTEIFANGGHLETPYGDEMLKSKFCLHVRGYGVNTARIGDAMYYGCVPVIIADHYALPFADVLDWSSFSVVVTTSDIPLLKKILKSIVDSKEYHKLRDNMLNVRKHFQWHPSPIDYDAFHMALYELWLRRNYLRLRPFS
ncbi:Exostosin-like [Trema orientale]|uniref:Exostosin-like n=1 Tax=Trema orientale TaxID=63057 RepID=A0A2P5EVP7_TREOI|nr:Exostosin-like [Trema orientale]